MTPSTITGFRRAAIVGVGNIGALLAAFIARHVAALTLIDPGLVELANVRNQVGYCVADVGRHKVDVLAEQFRRADVKAAIDVRRQPLSDVPWGVWLECDVIFACLDTLEARRMLISERAWPAGIPVIDGGVGEQTLGGVKLFLPGPTNACQECSWSAAHYRQASREYPCVPGADPEGPPTISPAHLGAFVAAQMTVEFLALCEHGLAGPSRQIDLAPFQHRVRDSQLRRSPGCRFDHARFEQVWRLKTAFHALTLQDLHDAVTQCCGADDVQLELRRGIAIPGLPAAASNREQRLPASRLRAHGAHRLAELGFDPRDGVRIRSPRDPRHALLLLSSASGEKGPEA